MEDGERKGLRAPPTPARRRCLGREGDRRRGWEGRRRRSPAATALLSSGVVPPARGAVASLRLPRCRRLGREGDRRRGWEGRRRRRREGGRREEEGGRRRRRSPAATALLNPGVVSRSLGGTREKESARKEREGGKNLE